MPPTTFKNLLGFRIAQRRIIRRLRLNLSVAALATLHRLIMSNSAIVINHQGVYQKTQKAGKAGSVREYPAIALIKN